MEIGLNKTVLNKVIAFKMLEILRDNNMIDLAKYKSIEKKRLLYSENVVKQGKIYKENNKNGQ